MLDITLLRKDLDGVIARLNTRKTPQPFLDVAAFTALEAERKTLQVRTEELQAQRNSLSKQIGGLKAKGQHAEADAVMAQVSAAKAELESSAKRLDQIQAELLQLLQAVPNLPHASVPVGADEHANVELRRWSPQDGLGGSPSSTWSRTGKSNARGARPCGDQRRTSTLACSSAPTGTLSCGRLGTASSKVAISCWMTSSRVADASSSSLIDATCAIKSSADSPLALRWPICLLALLRCACNSSVRV